MIRFGLVGTGRMAATMLSAFRSTSGVELAAVTSGSPERSRQFAGSFGIPKAYESLDAMLGDDSIDAVYVANRTVHHARAAIAALSAGKAVLCEKPFATTAEEGEQVILAARHSHRLFMEAIWTHLLPSHQRLFELVSSGQFGQPRHLYCDFGYPTLPHESPRLFAPEGGGALLDRGGYLISLALRLFGPVKAADSRLMTSDAGVDLQASLQLLHERGGQSQLAVSLVGLMSNTAVVACSEGMVRLGAPLLGSETVATQRMIPAPADSGPGMAPGYKQLVVLRLRRSDRLRRLKRILSADKAEHHSYGVDQYVPLLEHFRNLMSSGQLQSDIVPPALSLDTIRIIESERARSCRSVER